jgi:RNA polymerase sigma factor (sigma-70 family)
MAEPSEPPREHPLESTTALLGRARAGDARARELLFARVLPPLRRWAHQRMPSSARDLHDSEDMVQVTVLRAFQNLDRFESRGTGAFLGYLRQILLNAIRDELRRADRRPKHAGLDLALADPGPSALERVLGRAALDDYERALAQLADEKREAVIMRLELGFSHQEIADALGKPSANTARMVCARALVELAEGMRRDA